MGTGPRVLDAHPRLLAIEQARLSIEPAQTRLGAMLLLGLSVFLLGLTHSMSQFFFGIPREYAFLFFHNNRDTADKGGVRTYVVGTEP